MTDLELVKMGIKMIQKEKNLMVKKQIKADKLHNKKMEKLNGELTGLLERRSQLVTSNEYVDAPKCDTVTER